MHILTTVTNFVFISELFIENVARNVSFAGEYS